METVELQKLDLSTTQFSQAVNIHVPSLYNINTRLSFLMLNAQNWDFSPGVAGSYPLAHNATQETQSDMNSQDAKEEKKGSC